jgi:hypothetical protein
MTIKKRNVVLLIGIIILVGGSVTTSGSSAPLSFHETSKVGSILFPILFMALLLERTLDVFLTATRQADSQKLEREILQLSNLLLDKEGLAKNEGDPKLSELVDKKEKLARRKFETRLLALWVSLYAGVFLGCIGFQTLGALVPADSIAGLGPARGMMLHIVDMLLTGGVIAGGGEGVHRLMEAYRGVTEGLAVSRG